ncbi:MAG: DNA translocase FtsK, partial [FCB group bacterium]|nr:DNA translocase FtsK [FCB group bacterium]
ELLNEPPEITSTISEEVLHQRAEQLKHALDTFKVAGKIVRISPGPVITLYEIEPAEGVRVNKFTNLADDLARIMRAERIRVIAPIPGSKTVGIELPNDNPAIVALKSIITSEKFIKSESKLTLAMGKTTKGDAFVSDLAKMPHLLIAGATGSGKSICINTIIMSILYKAKPDEVKFIMIDPKKLELFTYKSLVGYHLITSANIDEYVMTSPENAVGILNSALSEMERRYTLFANSTVRSISEYHAKAKKHPEMENIPFIVVVIDELADLMLTAGRDVEEPITRLAQMARAVGIHLVVATQRPSVDVITGLIKANFPARIAFQVSQKVDSRTIIDQMGAEKLLGRGDMLFLPPGTSEPFRMHNAYISTSEIEAIMEHIVNQPRSEEIMLPEIKDKSVSTDFLLDEDSDELLMEAAKLVVEQGQASVSALQRRFRIGYSRAGRLIDELEALGVVSGYSGSKAREVLVDSSYLDDLMK